MSKKLPYDEALLKKMSKLLGVPVKELSKGLGFYYPDIGKEIKLVKTFEEGCKLLHKYESDKLACEMIIAVVTKILVKELEPITSIDAGWQYHGECPDASNWRCLINQKINALCLSKFEKNKDKMSLCNGLSLLGRCPDVGDSSDIIGEWVAAKLKSEINDLNTIDNGIELWDECKKHFEDIGRIEKKMNYDFDKKKALPKEEQYHFQTAIEQKMCGKCFKDEINRYQSVGKLEILLGKLTAGHFNRFRILIYNKMYKLLIQKKEMKKIQNAQRAKDKKESVTK